MSGAYSAVTMALPWGGWDFDFRKHPSALMNTTQLDIRGGCGTVIHRDFLHDFRCQIAQLPFDAAVLPGNGFKKAVAVNLIPLCVVWCLGQIIDLLSECDTAFNIFQPRSALQVKVPFIGLLL